MKSQVLMRNAATRCGAWALGASVLCAAAFAFVATPAQAQVSIGVSITVGSPPPPLPVYEQPPIPDVGYMWTPGYWAWDGSEYYWVPGTWVLAPYTGALWTPGYWGWSDEGVYVFHEGYWGPRVGYYGGINYGHGYGGEGYEGGHWDHGGFYYNRTVNNISNVHVTNVYNQTVVNNVTVNRVSYNGGNGGVRAQPTPQEMSYAHEQHTPPVAAQQQHIAMARQNPELRASVNHGVPNIAATARPAAFTGDAVVHAHGAPTVEGPRPGPNAQPGERPALRSEGFAPHPNGNPNAAPAHGQAAPERSFNRPETVDAPRAPRPEPTPAPREAPAPRDMARPQPQPHPAQPAPTFRGPPPEAHPAPPHPAPAARPAERPHPAPAHENKRDEQHPQGG